MPSLDNPTALPAVPAQPAGPLQCIHSLVQTAPILGILLCLLTSCTDKMNQLMRQLISGTAAKSTGRH